MSRKDKEKVAEEELRFAQEKNFGLKRKQEKYERLKKKMTESFVRNNIPLPALEEIA